MRYYGIVANGTVENDSIEIYDDEGLVDFVDGIWAEDEFDWAYIALNALQDMGYDADLQDLLHSREFPLTRFL